MPKFSLDMVPSQSSVVSSAEDADTDCSYCRSPCCQLVVALTPKETHEFEWQELTIEGKKKKILARRDDGYCVYYVHGTGCSTYDNKPWVCDHYSCRTDRRMSSFLKYGPIVPVLLPSEIDD